MYWALQNLKDSENKQKVSHNNSILGAATVYSGTLFCLATRRPNTLQLADPFRIALKLMKGIRTAPRYVVQI
jgi:hypothetical protein